MLIRILIGLLILFCMVSALITICCLLDDSDQIAVKVFGPCDRKGCSCHYCK